MIEEYNSKSFFKKLSIPVETHKLDNFEKHLYYIKNIVLEAMNDKDFLNYTDEQFAFYSNLFNEINDLEIYKRKNRIEKLNNSHLNENSILHSIFTKHKTYFAIKNYNEKIKKEIQDNETLQISQERVTNIHLRKKPYFLLKKGYYLVNHHYRNTPENYLYDFISKNLNEIMSSACIIEKIREYNEYENVINSIKHINLVYLAALEPTSENIELIKSVLDGHSFCVISNYEKVKNDNSLRRIFSLKLGIDSYKKLLNRAHCFDKILKNLKDSGVDLSPNTESIRSLLENKANHHFELNKLIKEDDEAFEFFLNIINDKEDMMFHSEVSF